MEKCQACGCVSVCPNSFLKIGLRLSFVIFYPITLSLPIGSWLHSLPCFAPTPPCVCHIPELPVGMDNSYVWDVKGASLVKGPFRHSLSSC